MRRRGQAVSGARGMLAVGGALLLTACELADTTVVDLVDVAVAEVYVVLRDDPADNTVRAFLHGTSAGSTPNTRTFDDALVQVTRAGGLVLDLAVVAISECVDSVPNGLTGTCFDADPALAAQLAPGDALDLEITLGGGDTVLGAATVPGAFQLSGLGAQCRVPPDTLLDVVWSRADGAWAYWNETVIEGLADALASEGIEADDPLYLLGLSVSAADTTIVFPSEFGVFDRFDLDQDLSVRLQRGLPDDTNARVSIAAVDRNYVNWVRGGNFNPSGAVRVSSLRGAATGVFGATVIREVTVASAASPIGGIPDCV
jgi:hypothetical protein